MAKSLSYLKYPELIFGIAGPIGVDVEEITRELAEALKRVAYPSTLIKLTDEISGISSDIPVPENPSFYNHMKYKMAHASAICRAHKDEAYLMRIVLSAIRRERAVMIERESSFLETPDDGEKSVYGEPDQTEETIFDSLLKKGEGIAFRSAFIIRQIKRPEEVSFLRQIYGQQFILISAYGSAFDRQKSLQDKIKASTTSEINDNRSAFLAGKLIEADMNEDRDTYGQHMRDTFHLADVIIDGLNPTVISQDIERFISALFGSNEVGPTRDEYGMSIAQNAAYRSSDLSRQIGAVIFSESGEILSQGCNEVPKAFGGSYWDGELPDHRDIKIGKDSNDIIKIEVIRDLIDRMKRNGLLSEKVLKRGSPGQITNFLIGRSEAKSDDNDIRGVLKNAKILDLTEYGRVVHAEMSAICDAARIGLRLRMGTLFTTTFPCHNCTKHILAAGIKKVVFLEPYPKSKAKELHSHEIEIEGSDPGRVSFMPFRGITPSRFAQIFSKGKRKRDGVAVRWQHGSPAPMVNVLTPNYLKLEELSMVVPAEAGPS